jgi:hypothetical protein
MRRTLLIATVTMVFVGMLSGTALATECINASKSDHSAGAQLIIGPDFQTPIYISKGLQERFENGVVDFETGEGFHGIVAFDTDGDGVADLSAWFGVGPDGEIPLQAQFAGPACRGLTNIGIYLTQCVGA